MESTLTYTLDDLQAAVGEYAGYGPTVSSYTTNGLARVNKSVKEGIALVYSPGQYEWSWLKPVSTVILAEDANTVLLPDDFNWLQGSIIPASSAGEAQFSIPVVGEGQVFAREAISSTTTGKPQMACVQSLKGTDLNQSSRSQLKVWPIADQEYTLQIKYSLLPNALTDARPYFYGGAAHAQTFKAACIAAYESNYDGGPGVQWQKFQALLANSIETDRKRKPNLPGLNLDRSDMMDPDPRHWTYAPMSVNGVIPGAA